MPIKRVQKQMNWTAEDKERRQKIRAVFQDRPCIDELVARGELSGQTMPLGVYLNLKLLVRSLRLLREQARLSLADLSQRTGMDKAMLSRLENGHVANPGIETICRYVHALNRDIEWRVVPTAGAENSTH